MAILLTPYPFKRVWYILWPGGNVSFTQVLDRFLSETYIIELPELAHSESLYSLKSDRTQVQINENTGIVCFIGNNLEADLCLELL